MGGCIVYLSYNAQRSYDPNEDFSKGDFSCFGYHSHEDMGPTAWHVQSCYLRFDIKRSIESFQRVNIERTREYNISGKDTSQS
jgi:hypothetical protein